MKVIFDKDQDYQKVEVEGVSILYSERVPLAVLDLGNGNLFVRDYLNIAKGRMHLEKFKREYEGFLKEGAEVKTLDNAEMHERIENIAKEEL